MDSVDIVTSYILQSDILGGQITVLKHPILVPELATRRGQFRYCLAVKMAAKVGVST
jgi:hypothetical protein